MISVCKECKKEFNSKKKTQMFCSKTCSIKNRNKDKAYLKKLKKKKTKKEKVEILCLNCGEMFIGYKDRKFCSCECNNKYRFKEQSESLKRECLNCGKKFKADKQSRQFCSIKCSNVFKATKEEYKDKLSKACKARSSNLEYLNLLSKNAKDRWSNDKFRNKMMKIVKSNEWLDKIEKNSKRFKDYKLPSGKIVKIQGYENLALDILLKKYNESDIFIQRKEIENQIGKILYVFENKEHLYIPDIYVKSENKIIEVKSSWTYKKHLNKNLAKEKQCKKLGFNFEFMIL